MTTLEQVEAANRAEKAAKREAKVTARAAHREYAESHTPETARLRFTRSLLTILGCIAAAVGAVVPELTFVPAAALLIMAAVYHAADAIGHEVNRWGNVLSAKK